MSVLDDMGPDELIQLLSTAGPALKHLIIMILMSMGIPV